MFLGHLCSTEDKLVDDDAVQHALIAWNLVIRWQITAQDVMCCAALTGQACLMCLCGLSMASLGSGPATGEAASCRVNGFALGSEP